MLSPRLAREPPHITIITAVDHVVAATNFKQARASLNQYKSFVILF